MVKTSYLHFHVRSRSYKREVGYSLLIGDLSAFRPPRVIGANLRLWRDCHGGVINGSGHLLKRIPRVLDGSNINLLI